MTMSRGLMRVLLATLGWTGVLVTYGATKIAMNASAPIPDCNCNVWQDCDAGGMGWKCTSSPNLCEEKVGDCGTKVCKGYCEKST
jgi:hypothetical protein